MNVLVSSCLANLFHSLVVCGAGLTLLQCGGRYGSGDGTSGDDGDSGASQAGAGGKAPSGGGVMGGMSGGAGASSVAGTGVIILGGAPAMPTGGSGPAVEPKPPGPSERWTCDFNARCGSVQLDTATCMLDLARPPRPSDCPPGTRFACLTGRLDDEERLFNCECTPIAADGSCVCPKAECNARLRSTADCTDTTVVCDCAVTCILK